ncbi:MAG: VOC family protein [Minicystis sp.]
MKTPLYLDVAVSDVSAAVRFYEEALAPESTLETPSGAVELWLVAGGGLALRVIAEAAHVPSRADRDMYVKGKTPRLELVVDDVDARVDRLAVAGAIVKARLVAGEDGALRARREGEGPTRYAQVLDPFGHLWAIAAADAEEEMENWA